MLLTTHSPTWLSCESCQKAIFKIKDCNCLNMKISYNWLKQIGNFTQTIDEISAILTDSGLEVDAISEYESIKGGLKGVFVGQILTCSKHPEADRLWVTTVDVGKDAPLHIVCGAPNASTGQKVLVAVVGAMLHTPKGTLEIKKAKIRGQLSEGMICAEDELGLGDAHDGILVLPADAPVGLEAAQYLGVYTDKIFEIGLTPNRIDAASHFGVARDLAAVVNHRNPAAKVVLQKPSFDHFVPDNLNRHIPVVIEDTTKCPRYAGVTITGVKVAASPKWLQEMLLAIGLRPINNIVDISNFVMHEFGHPLHAFDADTIEGDTVVIRCPEKGTPFVTLDGKEILLTGEDLMVCSATKPMCIGGVLGGIHSGVSEATTNIFLESAYFHPVSIRKSSKAHGIKTDASFRFERGADPNMVIYALKRAAVLIKEVAGGSISSEIVDVYPEEIRQIELEFCLSKAAILIGKQIPNNELRSILHSLDIGVLRDLSDTKWLLRIPTYRVDVTRECDVVEEILRIYGYNSVELPERLTSAIVLSPKPNKEALQNIVSDMLSGRGFYETMSNSLTKGSYYEMLGFDSSFSVQILNPLSQDLGVMRQSLLFGGLETIVYNINRKVSGMKLYEFGKIYFKNNVADSQSQPLDSFKEEVCLAMFMAGQKNTDTWAAKEESLGFFDLKAEVLQVFAKMGIAASRFQISEEYQGAVFAYAIRYSVDGKEIAKLGKLANTITKAFDIKQDVYCAILQWEKIMELQNDYKLLFEEVPKYPEVRRDLSLLLDKSVRFSQIENLAYKTEATILKAVKLFDVYQDKRMGENKKSYAVGFTLLDNRHTLTDQEIEQVMARLQKAFSDELGAEIR